MSLILNSETDAGENSVNNGEEVYEKEGALKLDPEKTG
jgi:hypothetical protein